MYAFQNDYCFVVDGVAKTNTLIIAERSGRDHKAILKNFNPESRDFKEFLGEFIRQGEIPLSSYDQELPHGGTKPMPMYEFTEEQALMVLPFIAGAEAFRVQQELVRSFMEARRFIEDVAAGKMDDPVELMRLANNILMERDEKKTKQQLTVTQLAQQYSVIIKRPVTPPEMNHILCVKGFQELEVITYNGKQHRNYKLTARGEPHGCYIGSSVEEIKHVRWIDTVLSKI